MSGAFERAMALLECADGLCVRSAFMSPHQSGLDQVDVCRYQLFCRRDTLFLAMPISWHGTLQQYVRRLHRLHDSKRVVEVYDYVDPNVRMLARMYDRRLKGYADMGYRILDSGARQRPLSLDIRH